MARIMNCIFFKCIFKKYLAKETLSDVAVEKSTFCPLFLKGQLGSL